MKVLVALSGGVDSSVAALLLRDQGHEVSCAYMKNWINEDDIAGHCPWEEDIRDARAAAEALGLPFEVVNFIKDYRERVVTYLLEGYHGGITPNPDVMCNREMKFGVLLDYALSQGFEAVATGHYAVRRDDLDGTAQIWEGADKNKDQSYFLALLRQEQIRRALFPVGHLQKPELRELARRHGLPNAEKKDSQGICFIGQIKMGDFLAHYLPDHPGPITDHTGRILGEHKGLHRFTLGQRKGLGIPSNTDNEHYVVVRKNFATNTLVLAFESRGAEAGLFGTDYRLHNLSWTASPVVSPTPLLAKPRYRDPSQQMAFEPQEDGSARIRFQEPQRALTPGQICALYDGEKLLGGGVYF